MDTSDQPAPQLAYDVTCTQSGDTYLAECPQIPALMACGDTPDEAIDRLRVKADMAVDWVQKDMSEAMQAPVENSGKVPVVAGDGGVDWINVGSDTAPAPLGPPASRSAQVAAAMAKVRVEQRRSMARRTPYGYRLGHPDGPHENAKRERRPNGRKSTTPDRRPLVENPREMEILDAIIAGMRKHADLPLGKAAYQVAKALRWHEIPNPRGAATWHSGSIKSIYNTAMAHRQRGQATVPTVTASSPSADSPTRPAPGPE